MPESVRFWKRKIEEMDEDNTFAVGLIYGPSGCGKSSLVKAGLLHRLSENVVTVYVEASAQETENLLLKGLRKRGEGELRGIGAPVPGVNPFSRTEMGLRETLSALRRGQGVASGKKVLIILD